MKKASQYRLNAAECRQLANRMDNGEHRDQLLDMAATWDRLAGERVEMIIRHPELALLGEIAELEQLDGWREKAPVAERRGQSSGGG